MGQDDFREGCLDLQGLASECSNTYYNNENFWHERSRRMVVRMQGQIDYLNRILEIHAERSFDVQRSPGQTPELL